MISSVVQEAIFPTYLNPYPLNDNNVRIYKFDELPDSEKTSYTSLRENLSGALRKYSRTVSQFDVFYSHMRNIRGGKDRDINLAWVTFMFKDGDQFIILSNPGLDINSERIPDVDNSQGRDCVY